MSPALPRVLFRLLAIGSMLAASSVADAQSVILPPSGVIYRKQPIRPVGQQPYWVSQSDCLAQDVLSFPLTLTGAYLGNTLQVWAANQGVDCTAVNERQPGGSAECWEVYSAPATSQTPTVGISAVDLVARNLPGATTTLTYPDACTNNPDSPPAGQALTLFFFFVSSGTTIVGTPQQWTNIGYDIAPPGQAVNVTAGSGDTRAYLNWTDAADSDIRSYNLYCDPPPGSVLPDGGLKVEGPPLGMLDVSAGGSLVGTGGDLGLGAGGDLGAGGTLGVAGSLISAGGTFFDTGGAGGTAGTAGVGGDGGDIGVGTSTGGTTTTAANCSASSVLQPGVSPVTPTSLSSYLCGSVNGITATSGSISHLVNNVPYVFSVAAVDQVGNIGQLSQNACATPVQLTDFFELYRLAGGKAGGGICSLSFAKNPARSGIVAAGAALAFALLARRSSRRRK